MVIFLVKVLFGVVITYKTISFTSYNLHHQTMSYLIAEYVLLTWFVTSLTLLWNLWLTIRTNISWHKIWMHINFVKNGILNGTLSNVIIQCHECHNDISLSFKWILWHICQNFPSFLPNSKCSFYTTSKGWMCFI